MRNKRQFVGNDILLYRYQEMQASYVLMQNNKIDSCKNIDFRIQFIFILGL